MDRAKTAKPKKVEPPAADITAERKGKYLLVRCGAAVKAFKIQWVHDHGETRQELTFVPLEALPRELEYLYAR